MAIRVPDGDKTKPLIPDILVLTRLVIDEVAKGGDSAACETLSQVLDHFASADQPTIEHILSHIRLLAELIRKEKLGGVTRSALQNLDQLICKIITRCVNEKIPVDQLSTPYHHFAKWISAIPRDHPVEVFTTNYDLLIEQALEEQRVPYFDGFIGSNRAFFDLSSIEHDRLPSRWARLWKLHGSINWWRTETGHIERVSSQNSLEQQMIYPSHLKYDQSRRLPYLAMLDRLKSFLAPGKGPAVLITCGFSFADQHLNELILQSLRGNPSAVCYTLLFGNKEDTAYQEACQCARLQPNLRVLSRNGGIIGAIEGIWRGELREDHPLKDFISQPQAKAENVTVIDHHVLLGDFAVLGRFLLQQCDQHSSQDSLSAPPHVSKT